MANEKDKRNRQEKEGFTHDSEDSGIVEMPSITNLLRRKKLKLSDGSDTSAFTYERIGEEHQEEEKTESNHTVQESEQTETEENYGIQEIEIEGLDDDAPEDEGLELGQSHRQAEPEIPEAPQESSDAPQAVTKTLKAQRRARPRDPDLKSWNIQTLRENDDPFGKGLIELLKTGEVYSVLFLKVEKPKEGEVLPRFVANAAVAKRRRMELWRGIEWRPKTTPDLWQEFLANEGRVQVAAGNDHFLRDAFGFKQDEWITLLRVGPSYSSRGVVVVSSHSDMKESVDRVIQLLQSPPSKINAA